MIRCLRNALTVALALVLAVALTPAIPLGTDELQPSRQDERIAATADTDASSVTEQGAVGSAGKKDTNESLEAPSDESAGSQADVLVPKTDTEKLALVDAQAASAVESFFVTRASAVLGNSSIEKAGVTLSESVAQQEFARAQGFAAMAQNGNFEVSDADSTVEIISAKKSKGQIHLLAREVTVFTYDDLADGQGGSDEAAFATEHEMVLEQDDDGFLLVEDAYDERDLSGVCSLSDEDAQADGALQDEGEHATAASQEADGQDALEAREGTDPVDQDAAVENTSEADESSASDADFGIQAPTAEDADAPQTSDASAPETVEEGEDAPEELGASVAAGFSLLSAEAATIYYEAAYNPALAIRYADKYALSYNPNYYNFNPLGGDCANFVSQCLYAGNLPQTNGWYYKSKKDYNSSWTYCPHMVAYFKGTLAGSDKKARGKYVNVSKNNATSAAAIFPGSPVLYMSSSEWSHATICVGYNSAGTPIIDAHNNDRLHVPYTYWTPASRCTIQLTKEKGINEFTSTSGTATLVWTKTGKDTCMLSEVNGNAGAVTIPATVANSANTTLKVTQIAKDAFDGSGVTSVDIGSNVAKLEAQTFKNCTKLTSVKLGSGLTSIGTKTFSGCTALKTVQGGSRVATIGKNAFDGCTALETLGALPKVKTIGKNAFRNCASLVRLSKFAQLKKLGIGAFKNCDSLVAVPSMPKLQWLGKEAFGSCDSLKKAKLSGKKLATMGTGVFDNCPQLASGSLSTANLKALPAKTFANCTSLASVKLNKAFKTVGANAFEGAAMLRSIKAKGVKTVGSNAFTGCTKLADVSTFANVETLGARAFFGCSSLKSIRAMQNVKKMGAAAFSDCTKLKKAPAFTRLAALPSNAFCNCDGFTTVPALPNAKSIASRAFFGCDGLKTVKVTSSVLKSIGAQAFGSCTALEKVVLPSVKLKTIAKGAFAQCPKLASFTLKTSLLSKKGIGAGAFSGTPAKVNVAVPSGKASLYKKLLVSAGLSPRSKVYSS